MSVTLVRLEIPLAITTDGFAQALAAIENGRLSVRLPRRIGASSYLVDAPRALTSLLARDLRRKQPSMANR